METRAPSKEALCLETCPGVHYLGFPSHYLVAPMLCSCLEGNPLPFPTYVKLLLVYLP